MKRQLWILFAAGILVSCNAQDRTSEQVMENDHQNHGHHDALHKWLEPLMKQVSAFQNATTERQAEKEFQSIHERLDLYTTYFE